MGVDDPFHPNGNDQKTKSLYLFFLRRTVHNFFLFFLFSMLTFVVHTKLCFAILMYRKFVIGRGKNANLHSF